MKNVCYLNGSILPMSDAAISPRDLGFLRGYAVFDVMPVVNGKPFLFEEHWSRLERSASDLGMRIRLSPDKAKEVMEHLIRRHSYETMTVRTVVSGGQSENGFTPEGHETLCMMIEETLPLPRQLYRKGGKIITLEFARDVPSSKITSYIIPFRERDRKVREGAVEILYTQGEEVLEASTSNFFIVKKGVIRTAKDGMLSGITRNLVIRQALSQGIPVEEEIILISDLKKCDEAFITASNKKILPIVDIDGQPVGNGQPGPISKRLLETYDRFVKTY
ncbi:MAG: aminotransferase class IV [Candidatus Moraniibacteriota bacterium]